MNGACTIGIGAGNCNGINHPQYTYVQASDVSTYFQLAQQYGYANYMFQTNQGPSFPAHQFLFSGTSAPDQIGDADDCSKDGDGAPCHEWFAAELADPLSYVYGCPATSTTVKDIDPDGDEDYAYGTPLGYPCYDHPTLATLLDHPQNGAQQITWKYYSHAATTAAGSPATGLWTAPNAIQGVCLPLDKVSGKCSGPDWRNDVVSVLPNAPGYRNSFSPILTDLGADPGQQQCELPGVSWVIPDGHWSDHAGAGQDTSGHGPDWVAAIVNAVGGYYYDANGQKQQTSCWSNGQPVYWGNTAIIITWDDWGGFYDHIPPWNCNTSTGVCQGYNDGHSGGYTYGFRVPLIVVSAYTGTYNGKTWTGGYLSGACGTSSTPPCPNYGPSGTSEYVHDFGSILNFIEYALGVNGKPIGPLQGGINPNYPYADWYAPDGHNEYPSNPWALYDFFQYGFLNNWLNPRGFTPINATYGAGCFTNPATANCWGLFFQPVDPDDDNAD